MSAISSPAEFLDHTTSMALEEKAKLQKHFTRFDIYFFLICTIVGVDTLGVVAAEGAQGFTWLIFLAVAFFVPYALIVAELGSAFPEEGGAYVWTRLAFGRLVAAVNAVFYWFSNPIWIGATLALLTIATVDQFFFSIGDNSWLFYLVGLAYIWFSVYSAILSFGIGKWIPTLGAWARIFVLGLFVVSTIIYAIKNGLSLPEGGEFKPTYALFIALVPVLFFNYVGFELPSAAGDEMKDAQKDVPFTVLRAAVTAILLYGLPILAVIAVLPKDEITGVDGFMTAVAIGLHGLRRRGQRDDEDRRGGLHPRAGLERLHVADGLRPQPGGGLLRRRRAARPRPLLGEARHAGQRQLPLGRDLDDRLRRGGTDRERQRLRDLRRDDRDRADVHDDLVHRDLPALIKLRYSHPHVNRPYRIPGRNGGRVGLRRRLHLLGRLRLARGDLPGLCRRPAAQRRRPAGGRLARQVHDDRRRRDRDRLVGRVRLLLARQAARASKMVDVPLEGNEDLAAQAAPA